VNAGLASAIQRVCIASAVHFGPSLDSSPQNPGRVYLTVRFSSQPSRLHSRKHYSQQGLLRRKQHSIREAPSIRSLHTLAVLHVARELRTRACSTLTLHWSWDYLGIFTRISSKLGTEQETIERRFGKIEASMNVELSSWSEVSLWSDISLWATQGHSESACR